MTGLTAALGQFVASLDYDRIPATALPLLRDAFTDTVAVIMVGVAEPVSQIVLRTCAEPRERGEARACLSRIRCSAADAALVGGTAAHALDYDDQSLSGHPSAVLVPAILAEGEARGASGRDLVTAYVAGYEVWAELLRRDANYHTKGWHPTSVYGSVAAAAAVSVLNRLPAERASAALAIAASHAGGLAANFGTMTKPYHAGMAARSGLVSARLAAAGMTANDAALEHAQGFLHAFSPGRPDRDSPAQVGSDWYLLRQRLCIKKYPTCYFMHRSFDATVKLLAGRGIGADDIAEIEVTMGRGQTAVLINEHPRTGLEAKFSEQFAMAAAVILGRMGVNEVNDETAQRADFQSFYRKVRLNPVDEYDTRDPAHSPSERVVIRLADGRTLDSGSIRIIAGHADDPLSVDELWEKFSACTTRTHTAPQAKALFAQLQAVETLTGIDALPTCERVFAES